MAKRKKRKEYSLIFPASFSIKACQLKGLCPGSQSWALKLTESLGNKEHAEREREREMKRFNLMNRKFKRECGRTKMSG